MANNPQQTRPGRERLAECIEKYMPNDGTLEVQPGLHLYRLSAPSLPMYGFTECALCVIAQGGKYVQLGEDRFRYDPNHYLITTMGLPTISQIDVASAKQPYLGFRLVFDPAVVTSVMVETGGTPAGNESGLKAIDVSPLDEKLLDATHRLVQLAPEPAEYRVLAPLVIREIVYRLLAGAQGNRLRHVATLGGRAHRMARAVTRLRDDFNKPLRVEDLAKEIGMSVSGFHAHFKAATALSPLQFQKELRLREARRLMLSENLDAGEAGYRVGYDDQSHFSREYKRYFGDPPMRDVERLRVVATV